MPVNFIGNSVRYCRKNANFVGERVGLRIIRQSVSPQKHYDRTEPESRSSASPNGCASERRRQPHQHLPFAMARGAVAVAGGGARHCHALACVGVPRILWRQRCHPRERALLYRPLDGKTVSSPCRADTCRHINEHMHRLHAAERRHTAPGR